MQIRKSKWKILNKTLYTILCLEYNVNNIGLKWWSEVRVCTRVSFPSPVYFNFDADQHSAIPPSRWYLHASGMLCRERDCLRRVRAKTSLQSFCWDVEMTLFETDTWQLTLIGWCNSQMHWRWSSALDPMGKLTVHPQPLAKHEKGKQESPADAVKPARRKSMPKLLQFDVFRFISPNSISPNCQFIASRGRPMFSQALGLLVGQPNLEKCSRFFSSASFVNSRHPC